MQTDEEIISVVTAHKNGKKIQAREGGDWFDDPDPVWNFTQFDYREKPEPMVIWVTFRGDVIGSVFSTEPKHYTAQDLEDGITLKKFVEVVNE